MSQNRAEKTETSADMVGCEVQEWDDINEGHYERPTETLDQSCMRNFGSRVIHAVNGSEINASLLFTPPLPPSY